MLLAEDGIICIEVLALLIQPYEFGLCTKTDSTLTIMKISGEFKQFDPSM